MSVTVPHSQQEEPQHGVDNPAIVQTTRTIMWQRAVRVHAGGPIPTLTHTYVDTDCHKAAASAHQQRSAACKHIESHTQMPKGTPVHIAIHSVHTHV